MIRFKQFIENVLSEGIGQVKKQWLKTGRINQNDQVTLGKR